MSATSLFLRAVCVCVCGPGGWVRIDEPDVVAVPGLLATARRMWHVAGPDSTENTHLDNCTHIDYSTQRTTHCMAAVLHTRQIIQLPDGRSAATIASAMTTHTAQSLVHSLLSFFVSSSIRLRISTGSELGP